MTEQADIRRINRLRKCLPQTAPVVRPVRTLRRSTEGFRSDLPRVAMRPGMLAQLALLMAIVNIAACLLANQAMTRAGLASMSTAQLGRSDGGDSGTTEPVRLTPSTTVPSANQSRMPGRFSDLRTPY